MSENFRRYSSNHDNFAYASRRYRDSSLAMCLDITRDLASEAYDFAEPKVIQGITKVKMVQLKGPQCGAPMRGRRRRRTAAAERLRRRRGNRSSRSPSSDTSGSLYTNDTNDDDTIATRDTHLTYQGTSSWTLTSTSRSFSTATDTEAEHRRKPERRGRSPTRRSGSVNAANQSYRRDPVDKRPVRTVTTLSEWKRKRNLRNQNKSKAQNADDERKQSSLEEKESSASTKPRSDRPQVHSCFDNRQQQEQEQTQTLTRGSFRQTSFGVEKEGTDDETSQEQSVCSLISAKSQTTLLQPLPSSTEYPSPAMALAMSSPLVDMAKAMISQGNMEDSGLNTDPCGVFDRFTDCTPGDQQRRSPPLLLSPAPSPPPPPPPPPSRPLSNAEQGLVVHLSRESGKSKSAVPSTTLPPSVVSTAKSQGIDVTIIVGKGSSRRAFPHNSHVLRYISDYFAEVMVPTSGLMSQVSSSKPKSNIPQSSWMIDFSHKRVEEWKAFYPFLEPPVKRTVSLDIHNLPVLLPWFHEFKLPLLLHQCDTMLSSLYFPNLEQNPKPGDLQDVLLFLYAALSCDLPQAQKVGVQVLESYLRGAPHLLLQHNSNSCSASSLQRLIILLQCFPHFQQQLWDPVIRPYLPADLDACCDVDTSMGRDWVLQNPLFLFVLREGISKARARKAQLCLPASICNASSNRRRQADALHISNESNSILAYGSPNSSDETSSIGDGAPTSTTNSLTCSFPDEASRLVSTRSKRSTLSIDPGEEAGGGIFTASAEEPSPILLEMSYFLGQQFWGAGWNLEPRASQEQERRRLDRRHWLEEIVQKLKEHAQQEPQLEGKEREQEQGQDQKQAQDEQGHQPVLLEVILPNGGLRVEVAEEEEEENEATITAVLAKPEGKPTQRSVGARDPHHQQHREHQSKPGNLSTARHTSSQHVGGGTRTGWNDVKSSCSDSRSGLATATTEPVSLSWISAHTSGNLSNDSSKRTFRC